MKKDNGRGNLQSIIDRISFKSLPFDRDAMSRRLEEKMRQPVVIYQEARQSRVWQFIAVAASLALLVVSGWSVAGYFNKKEPIYIETTAVPDAKTKIMLPDQTVVWLNANASLRYPVEFTGDIREVELQGEAYFEVVHDESHPFIVATDGIDIRVLGTSFNVDALPDQTEITLISGSVALYRQSDISEQPDMILTPNDHVVYNKISNQFENNMMRPEQVTSWVTGNFYFHNSTLDDIMRELQRAFHVKIHIEDPMLASMTFNADFTDHETLDEILEILRISARYRVEWNRGEIYLKYNGINQL